MVHDLLFHALLLRGILWFSVILRWVWRQRHAATSHATTRATRRSHANQPFPGLPHQPSCATCEDGVQEQATAPPAAPLLILPRRGCPCQGDTQPHGCPSPCCDSYGWVGGGHGRANGHPSAGRWRQLQGMACGTSVLETHGPPVHGTRVAPERVVWAVGAFAEGLGIRAVARVCTVDPNPVLAWWIEAADHLEACSRSRLHEVQVSQVQLDE
jgi:hypothetical protein